MLDDLRSSRGTNMNIDESLIPVVAPSWAQNWPDKRHYTGLFGNGIKLHYTRVKKPLVGGLKFLDDGVVCTLEGRFRPQWVFREGKWLQKCSCNYPKDTCIHTWYLSVIIEYAFSLRGWTVKAKPEQSTSKASTTTRPRRAYQPGFDFSQPNYSDRKQKAQVAPVNLHHDLQVEVDFKLNPGMATLRFYDFSNNQRRILRMQQLLNLCTKAMNGTLENWNKEDTYFLKWLKEEIKEPQIWRDNLQVLKVLPKKFEKWTNSWRDTPDRFLDKETQKPMALKVTAGIHFELIPEGEKTRIQCFISTSDSCKEEFHKVYPSIRDKNKCLLKGAMVHLDVPINWKTLVECFSKKAPNMPTKMVPEHLPTLLENRLDLFRGKFIDRETDNADLVLRVRSDNGNIYFEALQNGQVISKDGNASSGLVYSGNRYKVSGLSSPVLDILQKLPSVLGLDKKPILVYSQSEDLLRKLIQVWPTIMVPKVCSSDLEGVLNDAVKPQARLSLREDEHWLNYSLSWEIGENRLSNEEMQHAVEGDKSLYRSRGGDWLNLDLSAVSETLIELKMADILKSSGKRLKMEAKSFLGKLGESVSIPASSDELVQRLKSANDPQPASIPEKLQSILRSYQKDGVEFLYNRLSYGVGVILADDMGLGKTFQTLTLMSTLKNDGPALVVAPASVVYVWQDEAAKFVPDKKVKVVSGTPDKRKKIYHKAADYDVLILNYHQVRNDIDYLNNIDFSLTVLDEAQFIKNPDAQITRSVKMLNSKFRLALSGTPVENRLSDLWSIFDFLNPGLLGDLETFNNNYEYGDSSRSELAARVRPLILRRTKENVAKELPPRTEEIIKCTMEEKQQALYKGLVASLKKSMKGNHFSIFAALTKLRQLCCDPRLLQNEIADTAGSAKLNSFLEMIVPIIEEGHSVLVFSQFTSMLDIIEQELSKRKISQFMLTGATPTTKRPAIVKQFNDAEDASVFLLSLKAAGTGLTLTKADYVFIYDPWWNPAAEKQAIDRTHRIGQDKPVFVYKMVTLNSVEEKILKLQAEKQALFDEILEDDAAPAKMSKDELISLLDDF